MGRLILRENGRSERIRTSDPLVPNEVRYQAALHSDPVFQAFKKLVGSSETRRLADVAVY